MLCQDRDETLYRSEYRAVDHDRAVALAIRPNILQIEAFGHRVIDLNGTELPRPSQAITEMKIDLRSVESAITFIDNVIKAGVFQRRFQVALGLIPHLDRSHVFFRPC